MSSINDEKINRNFRNMNILMNMYYGENMNKNMDNDDDLKGYMDEKLRNKYYGEYMKGISESVLQECFDKFDNKYQSEPEPIKMIKYYTDMYDIFAEGGIEIPCDIFDSLSENKLDKIKYILKLVREYVNR
jgi:hypothetical protein